MRRIPLIVASTAIVALAACTDTQQPTAPADPSAAPIQPAFGVAQQAERVMAGRVLARLADGADPASVGRAYGLEVERERPGYVMYRGAANGNERALAARMGGDAQIVWAQPDFLRQPTAIDPRLWAFDNPGGLSVTFTRGGSKGSAVSSYLSLPDADEDALEGLASTATGTVDIASIDTGVEFGHPEFDGGATLLVGGDYYDGDNDPADTNDHGTHTTGTMVGLSVGVAGVTGAAQHVRVWVYRVCGPIGCPSSAIADAIRDAAANGVVAMNLSLGGGSLAPSEADAIDFATANGALVIASAGNGGTSTVSCPACDPDAISVAASDWLDQHAYYTNWGSGLDITAPGGELYSNTTEEAGIYSSVRGASYAYFQGTSMAAPQVTGAAAVVALMTGLRGSALRAHLESTTDDLGASGYDTEFGNGRLNVERAITGSVSGGNDGGGNNGGGDPTLTASFTYACDGLDCDFTSTSTGAATWDWTFGSDGSSDLENPFHHFSGTGNYQVTLVVHDTDGNAANTSQVVQCKQRGRNGVVCN